MLADGLNVLIQLLRYIRGSGALEHEVVRLVHQNEPGQLAEIHPIRLPPTKATAKSKGHVP